LALSHRASVTLRRLTAVDQSFSASGNLEKRSALTGKLNLPTVHALAIGA
jgi:hypothetical protein